MNCIASLTLVLTLAAPPPDEAFLSGVRPTEPLTPQQQQSTFHLPPGFEIQLFAAEPDIQKPMNLAIDAAGRVWMSGSVEYPYAAAEGQGHDAIRVLQDTDGDGRADKITTFVDGLNIPIGLYPYRDGVIAYSMPNIWFFRDTDGDGRADQREVLYGPLGVPRDTHGMQNAFRRGFDGWLYVNHGFANETAITARDGSSVKLQSGNTYRLRLDGSRVEQYTWGQVNPFGSAFLPDGDLITADCHSKPLTLLLRGAFYTSFGKPHDGLGFAPDLMSHDHGSTAICGVVQLTGDNFPPEFRGRLLVGNVMTSRVNQDVLNYTGSSPRAVEQQDFLSTQDPWFRPVDMRLGPDGALYIADFYNRIIGHYEVPLEHPGRDKHRARIWRVTYRGQPSTKTASSGHNMAQADVHELIDALSSQNLSRRMLASDQLTDRIGESAVPHVLAAAKNSSSGTTRSHALWVLHRLNALPAAMLMTATNDAHELVRIHAQRILSETSRWTPEILEAVQRGFSDDSPMVRRAAADAAGEQASGLAGELLGALRRTPANDPVLRYTLRMAVRNQLRRPGAWATVRESDWPEDVRELLADIALGVPSPEAAGYLFTALRNASADTGRIESQLTHLAVNLPASRIDELIAVVRDKVGRNVDLQSKLLLVLNQRLAQRGVRESPAVRAWGHELVTQLFAAVDSDTMWSNRTSENPWGLEPRRCSDGESTVFLSSLPGGEQKTAVLRSQTFLIPPKLAFFLCGHLGFPEESAVESNYVQLRLVETKEVIAKALPPRNDIAQRTEWDLTPHTGKRGYLEVVDRLDLTAYAWLAVARFEPPVVVVPTTSPSSVVERQIAAAILVSSMKLTELREPLLRLVADGDTDWRARQSAAQACVADTERPLLAAMCAVLAQSNVDQTLREEIAAAVPLPKSAADGKLLVRLMQSAPAREQRQVADALAASAAGGAELLQLVERGQAAARLLQDRVIRQKLAAHGIADLETRLAHLTASLPTVNAELQRLIDDRRREFVNVQSNAQRGQELFAKHCAACHQVKGQGALVGPQLDGVGSRGVERVIEDVLDPNRNVDATFHVSILTLTDGRVVTGLVRREEGGNLILADQQGKEFPVLKANIDERSQTGTSLMPANVPELLKPDEFHDLIGYLLTLQQTSSNPRRYPTPG